MKKITLLATIALALAGQNAYCAKPAAKAAKTAATQAVTLKTAEDSLSQVYGELMGKSLAKQYYDSNAKGKLSHDDFMRGFDIMMNADTANTSYMMGLSYGLSIVNQVSQISRQQGIKLSKETIAAALKNSFNVKDTATTEEQMRELNMKMQVGITSLIYKNNDKKGQDFVAKTMAADTAFHRTASGLVYKVLQRGSGDNFKDGDKVDLTYRGTKITGDLFDQSQDTIALEVNRVVPGFQEALKRMKPGSRMQVIIPSALGYGEHGSGRDIAPGDYLQFDINAVGLHKELPAQPEPTEAQGAASAKPAAATSAKPSGKTQAPAPKKAGKKASGKK